MFRFLLIFFYWPFAHSFIDSSERPWFLECQWCKAFQGLSTSPTPIFLSAFVLLIESWEYRREEYCWKFGKNTKPIFLAPKGQLYQLFVTEGCCLIFYPNPISWLILSLNPVSRLFLFLKSHLPAKNMDSFLSAHEYLEKSSCGNSKISIFQLNL